VSGATFLPGEVKIRPGVYVRITNVGEQPDADQGAVAAVFRASWGPLGQPQVLESLSAVDEVYGTGGTTDVAREAFRGGARRVVVFRLGSGGSKASATLQDASGTDVVRIEAKYEGTRGNSLQVTVRDSLADASKRELLVYEGTTLRQIVQFERGSNEPQALVDAVAASGSTWITATKLADGDGTAAAVNQQALTGGTDPTVTGEDYSTALAALETADWDVLAVDSHDTAIHTTVAAYIARVRDEGKRVMAVIGEPTAVPLLTRIQNAKAINHPAIVYVGNGFVGTDGAAREGYLAAARVAGMIAAAPITSSLTHAQVAGAVDLVGPLTTPEIEQALQSGVLVFSRSARGGVQIEQGITTFVTPGDELDAGWRKIRRVRTRDALMARIVAAAEGLLGRVNNDADGRATLIAAMQGVVNAMVAEGALLGGTVAEDTSNPPQGDSAWFTVAVDDLDSAERVYITFGFRFAPPVAA